MSNSTQYKVKIGISCGDVNGIGPEIIIKTFEDPRMLELCTPIIYTSARAINFYKKRIGYQEFKLNQINSAEKAHPKKVNFINISDDDVKISFGKPSKDTGKLAFQSLEKATSDLASNLTDVLVTAPINKDSIQSDDFKFNGHTEYLASYANEENPLMILHTDSLRVGLVTGHVPVSEISSLISEELILKKLRTFHKSLVQDFGISKPKIAVLGLNPHSGDNGLLGKEEIDIIIPAIDKANSEKVLTMGPYAADGFFGSGLYKKFDGVLAMYHDQGLVPFKALTFNSGVNFTAGLPIVRTSPDHGTGYEIAGKNIASETSFRQAVYQAIEIFRNRKLHKDISANPLQPQEINVE